MMSCSMIGDDTLRQDKISPESCPAFVSIQDAIGNFSREVSQNEMIRSAGLCSTRAYAYTNGMCVCMSCAVMSSMHSPAHDCE